MRKMFGMLAALVCALPAVAQEDEVTLEGQPYAFAVGEGWQNTVEVGLTGTAGKTDSNNYYAQYRTFYEDDAHRWDTVVRYNYGETEGIESSNELIAASLKDWFFPDSPWGAFVSLRYEKDDLELWEYHLSAFTGVSYRFCNTERFDLVGRAGLGASRRFDDPDPDLDKWVPEGMLGLTGQWRIADNQTLDFSATYYPNLDDTGEFRALAEAVYAVAIDANKALKAGVLWQYDSRNVDPIDKDQVTYLVTFAYTF